MYILGDVPIHGAHVKPNHNWHISLRPKQNHMYLQIQLCYLMHGQIAIKCTLTLQQTAFSKVLDYDLIYIICINLLGFVQLLLQYLCVTLMQTYLHYCCRDFKTWETLAFLMQHYRFVSCRSIFYICICMVYYTIFIP